METVLCIVMTMVIMAMLMTVLGVAICYSRLRDIEEEIGELMRAGRKEEAHEEPE